jgi:CheY-like chemotaxis protein
MNNNTTNPPVKKIVIAEDSGPCSALYEEILAPTKAEIIKVSNGKDAIQNCIEDPDIAIAIVDIVLPAINGIEVIKTISKLKKNIKIIAVSASASDLLKETCHKAGCDEFFSKPIDVGYFMHVINILLKASI